jgi:type IV pilus assembly protein PilE
MIAARTVRSGLASRRQAAGFTLMEVMVVVLIVGILAAIGLPSYQEAMQKARRTDARESLMEAASRQEQYMLDRNVYTADMKELRFDDDPMISEEGHYSIDRVETETCDIDSDTCYALQATPREDSPQSADKRCTSFTLESTGAQDATGTDADNCW